MHKPAKILDTIIENAGYVSRTIFSSRTDEQLKEFARTVWENNPKLAKLVGDYIVARRDVKRRQKKFVPKWRK